MPQSGNSASWQPTSTPYSISQPGIPPAPIPPTTPLNTQDCRLPPLATVLQTSIPTLKHVPKGARDRWARVLKDCISTTPDNPSHWTTLFLLAKCVLVSRDILKLVNSRITRWLDGDQKTLWQEAISSAKALTKRSASLPPNGTNTTGQERNVRRAKSMAQDFLYSKSIQALTSTGLANPSDTILDEMKSKHPQGPPASAPPDPPPPSATISESTVLKCSKSFPKGSAPGPSGLRPSHLREAVCCPSPDRANQLLSAPFSGWPYAPVSHPSFMWRYTPRLPKEEQWPSPYCSWGDP